MEQKGSYKNLLMVYLALFVGQVFFAIAAFFMVYKKIFLATKENFESILLPVVVILALLCIIMGNRLFKMRAGDLSNMGSLSEKFAAYRAACLIKWAMLEGPCLFAIISYLLTGNFLFLLIAGLLLGIFISTYPTRDKVSMQLGISPDELDALS